MNKELKRKTLLSLATVTALSAMTAVPSYAFGEYSKFPGNPTNENNSAIASSSGYQEWYNTQWNNNESGEMDSGKIVLTPGQDEKDLNFAWYSETLGTPQVKVSTHENMENAKVFSGTAKSINKTNQFKTYTASNKVSVNDYFSQNTTYYYQYSIDTQNWSEVQKYQTHSFSNFQAVLVGDPQIGASGANGQDTLDDTDIAINTYSWNQTLNAALGKNGIAKDASFILSAGDQIDYSSADKYHIREQEYAGFLNPSVLRNVPLATTVGNHESLGDDYQLHYNNPNASSLGETESGGDYYYSYGDALFIVLNSNSRNVEEHRQLMNKAVSSHKDAKWKVVLFHHDIYGAGSSHSNIDGANLRILFAPLMDEFDIDVCLTGHDHSYARTYQIVDGKVIETNGVSESASTAYNPDGTLYIAAGSATGSKYYTLEATKQYYLAERSNNPIPTFSTIDFTNNSLTIKTYDNQGNKYANDVTIKKDANDKSITELTDEVKNIDADLITSGSKTRITEAVDNVSKVLDSKDDSKAIQELQDKWNTTSDPLNYYAYAQNGYASQGTTALKKGYSTLLDKTLHNAELNKSVSQDSYKEAYSKLLSAQNEVVTKKEFSDLKTQMNEANKLVTSVNIGNHKGEYTSQNVQSFKKILTDLGAQINESTITKTQLNSITDSLKAEVDKFKSSVNSKDIVVDNDETIQDENEGNNSNESDTKTPITTDTKDNSSKVGTAVKTGDTSPFIFFGATGVLSLIGLAISKILRKKEIEE